MTFLRRITVCGGLILLTGCGWLSSPSITVASPAVLRHLRVTTVTGQPAILDAQHTLIEFIDPAQSDKIARSVQSLQQDALRLHAA